MNDCRLSFRNEEDAHAFREHLGSLRQHGSNLLVTSEVSQSVTNRVSRTLFGARIELRRRAGRNPDHRWHVPELDMTTAWVEL